jgi:flagellar assembly protein FliH
MQKSATMEQPTRPPRIKFYPYAEATWPSDANPLAGIFPDPRLRDAGGLPDGAAAESFEGAEEDTASRLDPETQSFRDAERYCYPAAPGFEEVDPEEADRFVKGFVPDGISTEPFVSERSEFDPASQGEARSKTQLHSEETQEAEERGWQTGFEDGFQKGLQQGQEQGFRQGMEQGSEQGNRQLEIDRSRLHSQAAALLSSFSLSQEAYLVQLEEEAVRLALAIAARILRREAQSDPLLLTGAVRSALKQLAASTSVQLRVPAADASMWEEAVLRMPGLKLRPQVIADPQSELGDCRLETELGLADLGLWPQLKAIEKGFFSRPGTSDRSSRPESSPSRAASQDAIDER